MDWTYRVAHMYLNDFRRPFGGYEVIAQTIYFTFHIK
jgi:hypothetical protein